MIIDMYCINSSCQKWLDGQTSEMLDEIGGYGCHKLISVSGSRWNSMLPRAPKYPSCSRKRALTAVLPLDQYSMA